MKEDIKEKLIEFLMDKANYCYADDFPINSIPKWVEEFFDKYEIKLIKKVDTNPYGMKATVSDGIIELEDGRKYEIPLS